MGQYAVVGLNALDVGFVLAPERYDPRRHRAEDGHALADVVEIAREQVAPGKGESNARYLILDTSDAHMGFIKTTKNSTPLSEVGSMKKLVQPGDVIVSRLRPYLRQIALIDRGLFDNRAIGAAVACSTEFFVLRSRDQKSIAFLVPFLLSDPVQVQLAASQEGGHHPRFNQSTLERLRVPNHVLEERDELSRTVEQATDDARRADDTMLRLVDRFAQ